ncbi:WbqC family protein [Cochleicola gelatinilyticus]|uniref:WbqC-like protein n=1 Tax=Cochleicola gelatinilyticus TaxID=1763537 RepID=A0A167K7T7_9FLAO|nr:WbqC family protein [Cochleicola gelatinilyticus]OAB81477.1 hypothetical protein ULVI_01260 [Cochleicola gelatinilyticus]
MKSVLLYPAYFPCIVQMVAVVQSSNITFEVEDNYQKQTYRNRAYIAHTNGRLLLNAPIKHSKNGRHQKTSDVQFEKAFPWREEHWKSIQNAYRTSPFFEYYEDDLAPLFKQPESFLLKHNFTIFETICELIGFDPIYSKTTVFEKEPTYTDLRYLVNAKLKKTFQLQPYTQVFEAGHGFLPNLSILDLVFNEGPNTLNYLESQELNF